MAEIFDDVEDQSEFFGLLLKDIVDEHMSCKRMRVRDGDVAYMTTEWKEAIRRRRKAVDFTKLKLKRTGNFTKSYGMKPHDLDVSQLKTFGRRSPRTLEVSHMNSIKHSCLFLDQKRLGNHRT